MKNQLYLNSLAFEHRMTEMACVFLRNVNDRMNRTEKKATTLEEVNRTVQFRVDCAATIFSQIKFEKPIEQITTEFLISASSVVQPSLNLGENNSQKISQFFLEFCNRYNCLETAICDKQNVFFETTEFNKNIKEGSVILETKPEDDRRLNECEKINFDSNRKSQHGQDRKQIFEKHTENLQYDKQQQNIFHQEELSPEKKIVSPSFNKLLHDCKYDETKQVLKTKSTQRTSIFDSSSDSEQEIVNETKISRMNTEVFPSNTTKNCKAEDQKKQSLFEESDSECDLFCVASKFVPSSSKINQGQQEYKNI